MNRLHLGFSRRELMQGGLGTAAALAVKGSRLDAAALNSQLRTPQEALKTDASRESLSRSGSYLSVTHHFWDFGASPQVPAGEFYVRCMQDEASPSEIFRIEVLREGQPMKLLPDATPGRLILNAGGGSRVEFCIADNDLVRIRGTACTLRLHLVIGPYANAVQIADGVWALAPDTARSPVQVKRLAGAMHVDATIVDDLHHAQCDKAVFTFDAQKEEAFECSLQFYEGAPRPHTQDVSFDEAAMAVESEFEEWAARIPLLEPEFEPQRRLAAYVLWSSTVAPRGLYRRPVVWGSKNWATRIWSWDHCFAAMGLANSHPDFAWQQFLVFCDMQDPVSGMLADSMSPIKRSWVCTKDPIHGWTLGRLMKLMPGAVTPQRLREAYGPLSLWTNYWVKYRNLDGDGLPCITHPDESFDDTTSNTLDGAVKAPEIATYLALQMTVLSDVAEKLGYASDARRWREQSDTLVKTFARVLWDEKRRQFVSKRVRDDFVGPGDCVLPFIPLLLGDRLPAAMRQAMVQGLETPGRFLTPFGFSTEALTSPLYNPDSYVKGPTWPPINFFLAEGLELAGHTGTALKVRRGFLQSCLRGGMSEHFDARTGAPGGDPGYIWTAALFLLLGAERRG